VRVVSESSPRTKKSFGGCDLVRISPSPKEDGPKAVNLLLTFEEALKLHLSLGQALARLNSYNRNTKTGRRSAVNLCVFQHVNRLTVMEGRIAEQKSEKR